MKKVLVPLLLIFTTVFLAACSGDNDDQANESLDATPTVEQTPEQDNNNEGILVLSEPTDEDFCAYCNMIVYGKDHDMGAFSSQGIDHEGHTHFFDDIGCMLNYETLENIELDKYVRDFSTKEWFSYEEAAIVKSKMKTPMNYGYGFFKEAEDAEQFVTEYHDEHATLATNAEIAELSLERHEMKMEKMNNDNQGHGSHDEEMDHDHEMNHH